MRRLLLGLLAVGWMLNAAAAERPNIVLIFSDDQGYADLGSYGAEFETPNIDRIGTEGVRFTDWYVASPVCTPSRYGLLTGRVPARSIDKLDGALLPARPRDTNRGLREGEVTLAAKLREAGYRTAIIGKWHLGYGNEELLPTRHGFDEFYGFLDGCIDFFTFRYGNWQTLYEGEQPIEDSGYITARLTEKAVDFIERQSADQPFFLYIPHAAPHYAKGYDPVKDEPTNVLQAKAEDIVAMSFIEDEKRRVYAAKVKGLDDGVGEVLAALERKGLVENTWVIFMSDNGGDYNYGGNNFPLRGQKATVWEGGIRVPCLMRWPGRIEAGVVSRQPASALDLMPTVLGLAEISPAGLTLDGVDLRPTLLEGLPIERDLVFIDKRGDALRRGDWKLIRPQGEKQTMLFNLTADMAEKRDLAAARPDVLRELNEALEAKRREINP